MCKLSSAVTGFRENSGDGNNSEASRTHLWGKDIPMSRFLCLSHFISQSQCGRHPYGVTLKVTVSSGLH